MSTMLEIAGREVLLSPTLLRLRARRPGKEGSAPTSAPHSGRPQADFDRVFARVRTVLLSREAEKRVEPAITMLLRDAQFVTAWSNANSWLVRTTPVEQLVAPSIPDEPLRSAFAGYRDEIERVALASGELFGAILAAGDSMRAEVRDLGIERIRLPNYLDDAELPIELWEALRARDAAGLCFLAILEGLDGAAPPGLLAEYAELHCKCQRKWMDLLAWMFAQPCPAIVLAAEQEDWARVFAETADINRGVQALFEHAERRHPDGFAVGDLERPKD